MTIQSNWKRKPIWMVLIAASVLNGAPVWAGKSKVQEAQEVFVTKPHGNDWLPALDTLTQSKWGRKRLSAIFLGDDLRRLHTAKIDAALTTLIEDWHEEPEIRELVNAVLSFEMTRFPKAGSPMDSIWPVLKRLSRLRYQVFYIANDYRADSDYIDLAWRYVMTIDLKTVVDQKIRESVFRNVARLLTSQEIAARYVEYAIQNYGKRFEAYGTDSAEAYLKSMHPKDMERLVVLFKPMEPRRKRAYVVEAIREEARLLDGDRTPYWGSLRRHIEDVIDSIELGQIDSCEEQAT